MRAAVSRVFGAGGAAAIGAALWLQPQQQQLSPRFGFPPLRPTVAFCESNNVIKNKTDIYYKHLLGQRAVFLTGGIDDESAKTVCAQLL